MICSQAHECSQFDTEDFAFSNDAIMESNDGALDALAAAASATPPQEPAAHAVPVRAVGVYSFSLTRQRSRRTTTFCLNSQASAQPAHRLGAPYNLKIVQDLLILD